MNVSVATGAGAENRQVLHAFSANCGFVGLDAVDDLGAVHDHKVGGPPDFVKASNGKSVSDAAIAVQSLPFLRPPRFALAVAILVVIGAGAIDLADEREQGVLHTKP